MAISPWCVLAGRHARGDARLTRCLRRPTAGQDFAAGYDLLHGEISAASAAAAGYADR